MNATHLYTESGERAKLARCGKCGRVWEPQYAPISGGKHGKRDWTPEERYEYAFAQANRCCDWRCNVCNEPAWSQFQTLCRAHLNKNMQAKDSEREAAAFAKAKPSEDDGPLWFDDRIFATIDDLMEHIECLDVEMPEYVWCAKELPLHIDAENVIENATQDHHESVSESIYDDDHKRLQKLCDEWCESIGVCSYEPDYSRYVVVAKEAQK